MSIPPCGGDFQGIGVFRSDEVRKQRKKVISALLTVVSIQPARLSLR